MESTQTLRGSELRLTRHAAVRMRQRGIPGWYLALLVDHGQTTLDAHGALVKSMTKGTRARLQRMLGDAVITTAHRSRRRFH